MSGRKPRESLYCRRRHGMSLARSIGFTHLLEGISKNREKLLPMFARKITLLAISIAASIAHISLRWRHDENDERP